MNALGTPGTSKRRFFYGPGADNFDMALAKNLPLTESKSLLFRVEALNIFNHTQFQRVECGGRKHRQHDVWECHLRGAAANSAGRDKAVVLSTLSSDSEQFNARPNPSAIWTGARTLVYVSLRPLCVGSHTAKLQVINQEILWPAKLHLHD